MSVLKIWNGTSWVAVGYGGRLPTTSVVEGDLYAMYLVNPVKRIAMPNLGYGYTITNINVRCYSADPTTELDANIRYCDAWTTGVFPVATGQTLVKAINTTTGNYDSGAMTTDVASGKELYLQMDANVDYGVMWTITITYTLKTS